MRRCVTFNLIPNESYIIQLPASGWQIRVGACGGAETTQNEFLQIRFISPCRSLVCCVRSARVAMPTMPSILMHSPSSNTFTYEHTLAHARAYRMRALIRLIKPATTSATHFGWVSRVCTFVRVWLITVDICCVYSRAKKHSLCKHIMYSVDVYYKVGDMVDTLELHRGRCIYVELITNKCKINTWHLRRHQRC